MYPLYALLFADSGLSEREISGLFVLWSAVALVAEVPSGVLADRWSRRGALVAAGVVQAVGYAIWALVPYLAGFAAGFVLWSLAGALVSGAFQALLYDGLAAEGARERYAVVLGRCEAAGLAVQVPVAGAAGALYAVGGYAAAAWVSAGVCLAAAGLAATLPDRRAAGRPGGDGGEGAGYLSTARAGVAEVARSRAVRGALLASAAIYALDGVEEYFGLLAAGWGVPEALVPMSLLGVALAGALGTALAARASGLRAAGVAAMLAVAAAALWAAGLTAGPAGLAMLALFYGLSRLAAVVADARLQALIRGRARATVTSVAGVATEIAGILLYAVWALGGLWLAAAMVAAVALLAPRGLRDYTCVQHETRPAGRPGDAPRP
ncbi:MAG: MFS transporter [Thermoleophilia bacterium]